MRGVQRLTAYGVVRGPATTGGTDRVVLVRASPRSDLAGRWFLPGGGVEHGEHPEVAVVREVAEETGLAARVRRLRTVLDDVLDLPHRGVRVHTVRVVYDLEVAGGELRTEEAGTTDAVRWATLAEAARLPVVPHVAHVLGLPDAEPEQPVPPLGFEPLSGLVAPPGAGGPVPEAAAAVPGGQAPRLRVRQRLAAYGLAERGHGAERALLLTLFDRRDGTTPLWTLPGGGVDHGEPVGGALVREVHEETGLAVLGSALLGVTSRHFTGAAPDGVVEDYHGVGIVHRIRVGEGEPTVLEVDGTTAEARWIRVADLPAVPTASLVGAAQELARAPGQAD